MQSRAQFAEPEKLSPGGVLFRVTSRKAVRSSTLSETGIGNCTLYNEKSDKIVKFLKLNKTEVSNFED